MSTEPQRARRARRRTPRLLAGLACGMVACAGASTAQAEGWHHGHRSSGQGLASLLLSTSEYTAANITPGVTELPPGCSAAACTPAVAGGRYPLVFNNDLVDASFGVTSPVFLDELTPWGQAFDRIEVPSRDLVTSFSSKSELALNLSTDGRDVTFMGYQAPVAALDVSNSNTPGVVDPTNPVAGTNYRVVADLGTDGRFRSLTLTNAYSGNNGRAAILNNAANVIYAAGNAGNGSNPQPDGIIVGAGAQILSRSFVPEWFQRPGVPTPVGSFNVTQLGDNPDKVGKDTNFRGLTIFDNVVYYTKGGIWFANPNTLYVADEGNGSATFSTTTGTYTDAAAQTTAGLQKWVFDPTAGSWKLAYTLESGLNLGQPYTVKGYPTGANPATGLPWSPATDGLRNITGRVNRDGTATIWAITSTVSGSGDQGADPNKLVAITDGLGAGAPGSETFRTVRTARFGEVLRGVSFTSGGDHGR